MKEAVSVWGQLLFIKRWSAALAEQTNCIGIFQTYIDTVSPIFPDLNASILFHTSFIPLSYQIRNKFETNSKQIRNK